MRVSLAALAFLALCAGCGSQQNTLDRLWHASGQTVALVPGTTDYMPRDVRVSFLVVTNRAQAISRPTADVWLARSRKDVPFERTTARLANVGIPDAGGGDALYVTHVHVAKPGRYWLLARPVGGSIHIGGVMALDVKPHSLTPGVGDRAPASQTPTLATATARALTTRIPPDRALLHYSVAGSLRAHVPFVLVFATPRYCTSRLCGPVVDVVDSVRRLEAGRGIRFIHVEIYKDNNPAKGFNRWVKQWRLPSEPWIFLVGGDGRIKAKFAGAVSRAELQQAVLHDLT